MKRELKGKAMKTKVIIIVAVMFLPISRVQATYSYSWNIYSDAIIEDGDVYNYVQVYNDAKVDMFGGTVIDMLTATDFSTVNVSGGFLGGLTCRDSGTLNLSGDMDADTLGVSDSGTLNMFGGNVGFMQVWNYSTVNLYGGTISDYLLAYGDDSLTVNIYGYGFDYDPLVGSYGGGQLTGFWLDDTPFSIDLYYGYAPSGPLIDTWPHIVLIPEPATILLLGLGAINIRISYFRKGEKS